MPIINTIAPPTLDKIELDYDKKIFRTGLYGGPTVYKDNNGICHLYLGLYPVNPNTFGEVNERVICTLPEGFRPSIPIVLSGGYWGNPKNVTVPGVTRELIFARIEANGDIRIFYAPQHYNSIGQIWIDGTWVAE